jgi:hypothetical protein
MNTLSRVFWAFGLEIISPEGDKCKAGRLELYLVGMYVGVDTSKYW